MNRDLAQEPLVDLLLELEAGRKSVDLFVSGRAGPARLCIRAGRIVHAECAGARGLVALEMLLSLREGQCEEREAAVEVRATLDLGVAEALLQGVRAPGSGASKDHAAQGQGSSPRGAFETVVSGGGGGERRAALTSPGGFGIAAPRGTQEAPVSAPPKTLVGFPARRIQVVGGAEPQVPVAGRGDAPSPRSIAEGKKLSGTGYSSAPPPGLGEERVSLPRALSDRAPNGPQARRGVTSVLSLSPQSAVAPRPTEEEAELESGEIPSNPSREQPPVTWSSAAREPMTAAELRIPTTPAKDEPDTGPVSSLQLDRRSLERLEELHEAISSTGHAIPARPSITIEDWPAPEPSPAAPEESADEGPRLPQVGRYEILARLKSGGMGSVYLCRLSGSAGFRRLFAMKVLHDHLAEQEEVLDLFFREANLLAQLHHPNIVGIVDVGSPRQPYLVLDYVEGGSFHELLRASPHERHPGVVVSIVFDALHGLAAAHELTGEYGQPIGLVHNDVSPHNLLVGVDGTCRVTDFGVADAGGQGVDTLTLRGKPSYLAPERILRQAVDHRADLFSLGVVLYQGLTGVDPFLGATAEETLKNVLERPIAPPSEVGLRPPPCLDWVCMKALARNPSERFQSAEDMANQLRRVAAREDLLVPPSTVAHWVRAVLADTIEARRQAAQRGTMTEEGRRRLSEMPPGVAPRDLPVGLSVNPDGRLLSEMPPPSSSDFGEKTEFLEPSAATAPAAPQRRNWVLYAALLLALLALVFVVFFPERAGQVVQKAPGRAPTSEERLQEERGAAPAVSVGRPSGEGSSDEDKIHVPAIVPEDEK